MEEANSDIWKPYGRTWKGDIVNWEYKCCDSLIMGTTGEDGKPEMPARTAVLQSPSNTACIKHGKVASKSLKNRLEAIYFYNRIIQWHFWTILHSLN